MLKKATTKLIGRKTKKRQSLSQKKEGWGTWQIHYHTPFVEVTVAHMLRWHPSIGWSRTSSYDEADENAYIYYHFLLIF